MTLNNQSSLAGDSGLIAQTISKRDAFDRANRLASETEARNVYAAAQASGDDILADAVRGIAQTNGWDLTITTGPAGAESTKARTLFVNLLNVLTAAPGQVQTEESFTDSRLTANALASERLIRVKTTIADINSQALGIITQLGDLAGKASVRALKVIPTVNLADPGQLTRTAQAWEFVVLPQLSHEVKPNWQTIIQSLDADGLLAMQRFAPAWIRNDQSNNPTQAEADIRTVMGGVSSAMANALTDPTDRAIVQNADDCANYLGMARALSQSLVTARSSRDLILLNGSVQNAAYMIGASTELAYPATTNPSLTVR